MIKQKQQDEVKWHTLDVKEVLKILNTSKEKGLNNKEVRSRLFKFGNNELVDKSKKGPVKIFLDQFADFTVIILFFASLVSYLIGEFIDATIILAILTINAILGFIQEYKAEKAMEALKSLSSPKAKVIREGKEIEVYAKELVPGDIVILNVGDSVPADLRLIEVLNLKVNESQLTGESVPVIKYSRKMKDVPLADRKNMAYAGCIVEYGKAIGVVVSTGMNTEIGKIAKGVQEAKSEKTPLEKNLDDLGKKIAMVILFICSFLFIVGTIIEGDLYEIFLTSVSLAVSAVPEGLPAIITVSLALGMKRMSNKNAIVKKLSAVQTLGNVTVICSDKTGTLTKNEMTIKEIYDGFNTIRVSGEGYEPKGYFFIKNRKIKPTSLESLNYISKIGVLCNNAYFGSNEKWEILGDPTEGSLLVLAAKMGVWHNELKEKWKEIYELSFDSKRKMMSTICKDEVGQKWVFSKGAPDVIINKCKYIQKGKRVIKLTKKLKAEILEKNKDMASRALRNLALAYKKIPNYLTKYTEENIENDLVFVGLVGMIDPPRKEAKEAIQKAKEAGIRVVMLTGDHKLTAEAIAKELGLLEEDSLSFTGDELDEMDDEKFKIAVLSATVFARVSPTHKLKIIKFLKEHGEIVAVTGDGVNDAPSLKEAHLGIAMGITGTDVSKEAASMILADDNFSTIVTAIEEGREIYNNIRKFVKFLLASNFDEIATVLFTIFLRLPLPFLPVQILWLNLMTDGLPALALSADPPLENVMKDKPKKYNKKILSGLLLFFVVGFLVDAISSTTLYMFTLTYTNDLVKARTMVFTNLVLFELLFVFNCRSDKKSIWKMGLKAFTSNKKLVLAVLISLLAQISIIYLPIANIIFKTEPLNLEDWLIVILFSLPALFILPEKLIKIKKED